MKKLIVLMLALCLFPLYACATRERITSFTPEEAAAVSARFDELVELTVPDESYPGCCEEMTDADRLLYVVILFDSYVRSTGLCAFVVDEPVMLYDVPAALHLIGADEQAALLEGFLAEHDPAANPAFAVMGLFSCDLAGSLYPFSEMEETLLMLDMETAMTSLIARYIALPG